MESAGNIRKIENEKSDALLPSVQKYTANLYYICFSIYLIFTIKQTQYRFAVNFETTQ